MESDPTMAEVIQRLNALEAANASMAQDNATLRTTVATLEAQIQRLSQQVSDTASKVKVMRESQLERAAGRVFDNFDVLERILVLCPRKQLFSLQTISRSFHRTIDASPALRSMMFSNASDVLLHLPDASDSNPVWERMNLNRLFAENWNKVDSAFFIDLRLFKSLENKARYLVDTDLTATFECRIVSAEQSNYAMKQLESSLGRTYMSRPALPVTVWVAFLVPSLIKYTNEQQRAMRSPASVPPNVTAVVDIAPATLLEMYEVAEVMRKHFPRAWVGDPKKALWQPHTLPSSENDGMLHRALALMQSTPQYSGWHTVQKRSHSISDITDWL